MKLLEDGKSLEDIVTNLKTELGRGHRDKMPKQLVTSSDEEPEKTEVLFVCIRVPLLGLIWSINCQFALLDLLPQIQVNLQVLWLTVN